MDWKAYLQDFGDQKIIINLEVLYINFAFIHHLKSDALFASQIAMLDYNVQASCTRKEKKDGNIEMSEDAAGLVAETLTESNWSKSCNETDEDKLKVALNTVFINSHDSELSTSRAA